MPTPEQHQSIEERLARLSPDRRALLELRLMEDRGGSVPQAPAIVRRVDRGAAPLSYAQELMWLVHELEPGTFVYNAPGPRRLQGPLDVAALRQALQALVDRHEALRTVVSMIDGEPRQIVKEDAVLDLPLIDLSDLPEKERDAEVERMVIDETRRPFDLANDLVIRPVLVRLAAEDHVLLTVTHHIASDGWSRSIFYRELAALYDAFRRGQPYPLEELPIQYADYAVWQRDWLSGDALENELGYWTQHLQAAPALLELPTDRPRPARQSHEGARQSVWLPTPLHEALRGLGRQHNATLFMTLLAGFATLLHRYSGQDDVVIGTPIAGRNRTEIEGLIGYFTNTLALRVDLSGDPTFAELLARVRETTLGAFAHQDAPFEKVVAALQPERDLSRTPLFQVLFVLQNAMPSPPDFAGLDVTALRVDAKLAKFDLTLGMGEHESGLHGSFEYATDLFGHGTIERLRANFQKLLESVVAEPDQRISRLPLLNEEERLRVVEEWNRTDSEYPADRCLHELVQEQAARRPDVTAVASAGRMLSYGELNAEAAALAGRLRRLGVGRDVPVAVLADRSPDLIVALLAVLKAGGACLPLDPAYPAERLSHMLRDAAPPVLLAHRHLLTRVSDHEAEVLLLGEAAATEEPNQVLPQLEVAPADLCYLVYTSGSTGEPRGVMLTHRGLVNHATAAVDLYGILPEDRVLQFASISFDISIEEIFTTLLSGATLVLRPADTPVLGPEFSEWLRSEHVTVLDLPTAYWHEWVKDLERRGDVVPEPVRVVVVGGEKAHVSAYADWLELGGTRVRWFNTYGPTETSVVASAHEPSALTREDLPAELPIGRPIANTRLYVLDGDGHPVPIGVPGELYVGGAGVARGYLHRAELTAEKFVADPFGEDPGGRLYRTGDVVRYRADGELEFVGRTDDQLKIRGFRVEPGEIEAVLRRHPAVRQALVVGRDDAADGGKRLVAYVVPGSEPPGQSDLWHFLADLLPMYMVPSSFVLLDALPLTANGKVDRQALPEPGPADLRGEFVAPRSEEEQRIAAVWTELLALDRVGVEDNFFELGGHSLLATQVISRLRQAFEVELGVRAIFEHPTIAGLARAVEEAAGEAPGPALVPVDRELHRIGGRGARTARERR